MKIKKEKKKIYRRTCKYCKRKFKTEFEIQVYCSPKCEGDLDWDKFKEYVMAVYEDRKKYGMIK
jgi:hypothetical protein